MKIILFISLFIILSGCGAGNIPKDSATLQSNVMIRNDNFSNQTWIETPLYLSRTGFTDTFPVRIKFRASYKDGSREFIQLYVTKTDVSWGFYHSANGEDQYKFEFLKIDGNVDADYTLGSVTTKEHFGLGFSIDYLKKMSAKDWKIKVYGKKNEGVFNVPKLLSEAFLAKLICFEENKCN